MEVSSDSKKPPCLSYLFNSDFAGCGQLRSIIPNNILNAKFAQHKNHCYEGIVSSRMYVPEQLLEKVKILRFQRQTSEQQVQFIEMMREVRDKHDTLSFKLIYDIDDLIGEIPSYNFASKYYNRADIIKNFKRVTEAVDILTVSTHPLKKKVKELGGSADIKILPNYLAKYIYRPYEFIKKANKKPRIVFGGSPTHFNEFDKGDFGVMYDLLINTVDEFDWVIMGMKECPPWLKCVEDRITLMQWIGSVNDYATSLKIINADFGVAPLLNNSFNHSKSDIKILDFASADIIAMCSKITPYKEAQVFFTGDWKTDRDTIIDIFQNKHKRDNIIHKQRKLLDKRWMETAGIKKYREVFDF